MRHRGGAGAGGQQGGNSAVNANAKKMSVPRTNRLTREDSAAGAGGAAGQALLPR